MHKLSNLFGELRRRKVLNTLLLYVVSSWIIVQVASLTFPAVGLSNSYFQGLLVLLIILFPVALTISWFYDVTIRGFIRIAPFTERRVLNNIAPIIDRRLSLTKGLKPAAVHDGWYFYAENGPLEGLEYKIIEPITIGRAIECDITLLRSYISRYHLRIFLDNEVLFAEDLGSANGTEINGKKVTNKQVLLHGDEILFKDILFTIREYRPKIRNEAMLEKTTILHKD
ncbi:FHA domain-containing protein [Paraglaciecola hydrolytica]|uniref:FHA domain-containing protein n=1 Tax=Paraglaciecola hydrolytica TaxID=1799789 RepID=A0A136A0K0_9ALTE|nr:FHA domain-containing protein [Paraglaciecola hydrolytica]KXI28680.1 hypothetical protein AX660_16540 [Paraglaciecola hydrolytica]